ncbi:MAG: hypothetical protein HY505_00100 [Candidatus Yanofskybacteria bacterium]|nr:hypothetical protein [Candidatus Yanofskybacteria bacterium]
MVCLVINGKLAYLGDIDRNGFLPTLSRDRFTPETLKVIATKAKEVQELGPDPEPCSECKGTPYFPNGKCSSARHFEFY